MALSYTASLASGNTSFDGRRRHPDITTILSPATHKIIATGSARIYHKAFANYQDSEWTYSKTKGLLVFGRDVDPPVDNADSAQDIHTEIYWFRLVDPSTDRVVWMLRVPDNFQYQKDRPFFHAFCGSSRMFGFCFDEDEEASTFYTEVTRCTANLGKSRTAKSMKHSRRSKRDRTFSFRSPRIIRSLISAPLPSSFLHISHIGLDSKGDMKASKDIDPEWTNLLQGSGGSGNVEEVTISNIYLGDGIIAEIPVGIHEAPEGTVVETLAAQDEANKAISAASVPEGTVVEMAAAQDEGCEAIVAASPVPEPASEPSQCEQCFLASPTKILNCICP
ncbi:hypothetical protein FIBSPDRAFT_725384 [Athelia psychrophila]|uniref:WH1-domain-containing protein n=1 Tax=Athelia psychrophila TaxID=1759441 RepID=A0A166TND3_9AGAM|nr:hypothetical protein FIBSPDRAFT_725384 [Fibularhizoctonia sp. CBS 109695]